MHTQVRACFLLKLLAFIARVVACIAVSDFAFGRQRRLFAPPRFGTTDGKKKKKVNLLWWLGICFRSLPVSFLPFFGEVTIVSLLV